MLYQQDRRYVSVNTPSDTRNILGLLCKATEVRRRLRDTLQLYRKVTSTCSHIQDASLFPYIIELYQKARGRANYLMASNCFLSCVVLFLFLFFVWFFWLC